jgi:hypothetical protein
MCSQKALARAFEIPVLINQMGHPLAGFLATFLTGSRWDKPDLAHFPCPLLVMVGFSRWRAEVVLPEMHHFMRQG